MVTADSLESTRALLIDAGLAPKGILRSTGVQRHLERMEQGQISRDALFQYAGDLRLLSHQSGTGGAAIPVDFWDVRTKVVAAPKRGRNNEATQASEQTEYAAVHTLSQPEYRRYIQFLCRCYRHLCDFKADKNGTAVAVALELLREATGYARSGGPMYMTASRPGLKPEQQAIFLWQQVTTGTNRQVPYLHTDAYTHGAWARFNVVEMWRFRVGSEIAVDDVWGLSGFAERFIRDATNTNQIEHMTISALAQMALGIPALLLDILEDMEWILRKGTYAASQADKGVNRAVARHLLPHFRMEDPGPACDRLQEALAAQ